MALRIALRPYCSLYALVSPRGLTVSPQVLHIYKMAEHGSSHSVARLETQGHFAQPRAHFNSAHLHGSVSQIGCAPCVRLRQPVHPARRKPRAILVLRREGDVAAALAAAAHGDACGERVLGWGHWPCALIICRAVSRAFLRSAARAVTVRHPIRHRLRCMDGGMRARSIVVTFVPAPNELYG